LVKHNVYLNESKENDLSKGSVILHGHYRCVVGDPEISAPTAGCSYFLFFGLLRPYKGTEKLIHAFHHYKGPVERLVIAGLPISKEYHGLLKELTTRDERITLDGRHIPEHELAALVSNAEGVVLPYEYMYNSGALIYSLSAGTPVLAPASPANTAIQQEVGNGWLLTFEESVESEDLDRLSEAKRNKPVPELPNLDRREWARVGGQHLALYRDIVVQ
jgi:glycosyltransferase involved in cell wall biosynthesis